MTVFMTDRRGTQQHQGLSLLANYSKALQPSIVIITDLRSVEAAELSVDWSGWRAEVLEVLLLF